MSAIAKDAVPSLAQAMETLTAQWYNAVITGCGLDPETFQLVQGSQVIGSTSEKLWQFFDAVPPLSISNYFNPSAYSSFSQNYGGVITNLIPQGGDALQSAMGDYYTQWINYAKTKQDYSVNAFKNWAMGVNPSQAATWVGLYATTFDNPIFLAQMAWDSMLNAAVNPGVAAYNQTIADMNAQLIGTTSKSIQMNSASESTDISHTWSEGAMEGLFDIFFAGGEASYSNFSQAVATSKLNIDATFSNLAIIKAGPLSQPSQDSILNQYTPWYNSSALNTAYQENNNRVWKHGAPTWADTFGPTGNLQRLTSALVVVDGINITTTSSASIATADQKNFEAAASGGFFPFFEAEAAHGWNTKTSYNDQGQATITSSSPTGNPQVLGVIVTPIAQAL